MPMPRVRASGKNLRISLMGHTAVVIFNFITRRMFLSLLGGDCTGFSGLCAHLLNFLSLLEPGFDAACAFYLYKPLAQENHALVMSVMGYIRKIYRRVAFLTFAVGIVLLPVALKLSQGKLERNFALAVYILTLAEASLSFLLTHRRILPVSDQKSYTVTGYGYITFILSRLVQLAVLLYTGSYLAYLFSGIACGLAGELVLYRRIGRMYPAINSKILPLEKEHRNTIKAKVRSLFFCKVGAILCSSVDNMAVFAFLGLSAGAEYSNYTMLTGTCLAFVSIITGSAAASVGNLGVTSGRERMKKVYGTVYFVIFAISSFFAQALYFSFPLTVGLWVGEDMVLPDTATALFCLQMLISSLRRPTGIFLDGFGLFEKEKFKSLSEGIITLISTLIFAPRLGICGVIIGQLCGSLGFSFFFEPYILYRYGFSESFRGFLAATAKYAFAFLLSLVISATLCAVCEGIGTGVGQIVMRIVICGASVGTVFAVLFFDSEYFRQGWGYFSYLTSKKTN